MKDVYRLLLAAAILTGLAALTGCGSGSGDALRRIRDQKELVAAVPKDQEGDRSRALAGKTERAVLEALASGLGAEVRYVELEEEELCGAVDRGEAHIAAGIPRKADEWERGYSLTYGRLAPYLAVKSTEPLDSIGGLGDSRVGFDRRMARGIRDQFYPMKGIELYTCTWQQARDGILDGTMRAYVCGEGDARKLLGTEGITVQELPGLVPDVYAFYLGKEQYRLYGMVDRLLTGELMK